MAKLDGFPAIMLKKYQQVRFQLEDSKFIWKLKLLTLIVEFMYVPSMYCLGPEPTTPITPQPSSLSSNKRESARIYHNLVSKFGWYFYTYSGHRYHFNLVYS